MKKILFAAAALTIGIGAYTLPAMAQADDYGQHVYTQNEPSRFAPAGLPAGAKGDLGSRDTGSDRKAINERIDAYHKAY